MEHRDFVEIGVLLRPHGLGGEMLFRPHNPSSEILRKGLRIRIQAAGGAERDARVAAVRETDKGPLVTLRGVADRNGSEALRGGRILVPRSELPACEPGEFYYEDLKGAPVRLPDGTGVGTVTDVFFAAQDVLVIQGPEGEILVPVVESFVREIGPEGVVLEPEAIADG
jgi:16S rRNA processing protein RimM